MIDLRNGDCLELLKDIPDGSVDLILTDPPYGTTACKWDSVIDFDLMWAELKRIIKPKRATILFGSEPFSSALRMSNIKKFKYDLIWDKVQGKQPFLAKIQPMKSHEVISVFGDSGILYNPQMRKGKPYKDNRGGQKAPTEHYSDFTRQSYNNKGERYPVSIYSCNNANRKGMHPTEKPVELLEWLIKTYSNAGDTVLDFTAGHGSTGVACVNTNRKFIGFELDPDYFAIAEQRINDAMEANETHIS